MIKYPNSLRSNVEVLKENNYYPFGLKHGGYNTTSGNSSYQYKYNGKELQTDSGMYDYGARFYMPDLGRWGVVDPLAEKTLQLYAYANNNPIMYIDPTGMEGESIHLGKYGNVLKNIDDGDNGVYLHKNAKTERDINKTYSSQNTSAGGEKIGELGGTIDANYIYSNTLSKNIEESSNIWNPNTFREYVKGGGVSLPKNWTNYHPKINEKKQLILGYENK
nr:RHS repeat-associated core domain-containing protein [Chryseobacterium tagetis]